MSTQNGKDAKVAWRVEAWTDGASVGKVGPGGWAYVMTINGKTAVEDSGHSPKTTNQRMEMIAAIIALQQVEKMDSVTCRIHSDSAYLINGMTERWYEAWSRQYWQKKDGTPVKNLRLWKELARLNETIEVEWVKVKGHVRNPSNLSEMRNATADALAVAAKKEAIKSHALDR